MFFSDSRSSVPVPSINRDYNNDFGIREGMTTLGKNKDEFIYIDKTLFKKELNRLTSQYKHLDQIMLQCSMKHMKKSFKV